MVGMHIYYIPFLIIMSAAATVMDMLNYKLGILARKRRMKYRNS